MKIDLTIDKTRFAGKFFPLLFNYSSRFEFYKGSAGSGKSHFITQKLLIKAMNDKRKVLVCRKYGSTIRNSVFSLFKQILKEWQLIQYCKIRETDFYIQLPNGSEIIFLGLDSEEKLLSINGITDIFVEEIWEIEKALLEQLNLRLRAKADNLQIFGAFNPISKKHWLYDFCEVVPPQSFLFIHSTFRDNPFLEDSYIEALMELYKMNPQKARVFCDGEWGVDSEGLVITNWVVERFDPMELAKKGLPIRCGMDIGFVDKTSLLGSFYDVENMAIYVFQNYSKAGMQFDDIVKKMVQFQWHKKKIYCDTDKRAIDYFNRQGFHVVGVKKGAGSVFTRIAFLQNHRIIVHPDCEEIIMELENFSYIKDKKTNEYTNATTHEYSHSIDGLSYAFNDIYSESKIKTLDKKVLGL